MLKRKLRLETVPKTGSSGEGPEWGAGPQRERKRVSCDGSGLVRVPGLWSKNVQRCLFKGEVLTIVTSVLMGVILGLGSVISVSKKNKRAEINSRVLRLKYRPSHKKGPGSVNGGKFLTYGPVVYLR